MNEQTVNTKKSHGTKKAETAAKVKRQTDKLVAKIDKEIKKEEHKNNRLSSSQKRKLKKN